MDWFQTIDAYCERTDPGFWSEPLNAVTNAAFLLVLLPALRPVDGRRPDLVEIALLAGVFAIGIGSFLFHTYATRWASLADVIPITIFIFAYFAFALRRFVGLSRLWTGLGTLAFFSASLLAEPIFAPLAGSSAAYLPGLFAMLGIGLYLILRGKPVGRTVLLAGLVFTVSLGCRMADQPLCAIWPIGTHFLWHVLNAVTLGLLLFAARQVRGKAPKDLRVAPPAA